MSRELDLQIYLALNGYPLKEIPEERYRDYMREPHYSTNADNMLELIKVMTNKGYLFECNFIDDWQAIFWKRETDYSEEGHSESGATLPEAVSKAVILTLTGKEWSDK